MLITFKTLQQKTFKIEIEETEKVKALKEKIAAERGEEFPVEGQKLIYSGKILDDDKTISEYKIDPVKNFVVVMAVKAKPKPVEKPKESETSTSAESASPTPPSDTTTSETATTETITSTAPSTAAASETTESTSTTTSEPLSSLGAAESALLTGNALESSITELMSLGYSREQVMRALNSSYHNADRAAEYLLSGNIPDLPDEPEGDGEPQGNITDLPDEPEGEGEGEGNAPAAPVAPVSSGSAPVTSAGAIGDLGFLRNLPQFQLMRNQVQSHPETLPQLLQEIGRTNPQLLQLISQNQEAFIALLNEPSSSDSGSDASGGGGSGSRGPAGGAFQIQVTSEEKEAIDRIVSMGFQESEVIQAFFACEKNEQLAIEFLLSQ